jgi:hypothetical protein
MLKGCLGKGRACKLQTGSAPGGTAVACLAAFAVILGIKLCVINYAASATPIGDEWDAGAAFLFKPYVEGILTFSQLFKPQNEHTVFFTKILMLAIANISGYWDVVLQMIVNAIIHAAVAALILASLARATDQAMAGVVMLAGAFLATVPCDWENTLMGFNTHFDLLLLFSILSLFCFYRASAYSARWWLGLLLVLGAQLNMAGGVLALAAAACLCLIQCLLGRRSGRREWEAIAVLGVMIIALIQIVPSLPHHEAIKAHSIAEFFSGFVRFLSWPMAAPFGVLLWIPSLIFCFRMIKEKPDCTDVRWFNVAVLGWVWLIGAATAYSRTQGVVASRYSDWYEVGAFVNIVSAICVTKELRIWGFNCHARTVLTKVLLVLAVPLMIWDIQLALKIDKVRGRLISQSEIVRSYISTKDASILSEDASNLPYPSAARLRDLLDDASVQSVLPGTLTSSAAPWGKIEILKYLLLRGWYLVFGSGVLLFLIAYRQFDALARFGRQEAYR